MSELGVQLLDLLKQARAEGKRSQFIDFLYNKGDIELLCLLLSVMAKRGQTRPELMDYGLHLLRGAYRFNFVQWQVYRTVGFLRDQGLICPLQLRRDRETVFRAIPRAIDALIRQIQADGEIANREGGVLAEIEARTKVYHQRVSQALGEREREKVVSLEVARVKRRM
jgi:hypothetical protein